jgi:hypothetical protein
MVLAQDEHPESCDDGVPCTCGSNLEPEWRHAVRWALEDLRNDGWAFNSAKSRPWTYIAPDVLMMDDVRIDVREGLRFRVRMSGRPRKIGLRALGQSRVNWLNAGDSIELGNAPPRLTQRESTPEVSYLARITSRGFSREEGWIPKRELIAPVVEWMDPRVPR